MNTVEEYVAFDERIKTEEITISALRKQRKELERKMIEEMKRAGVEEVVSQTGVVFKISRKLSKKKPE